MARKKTPPPPLLAVKFDFYDSLDNVISKIVNLYGAVKMVVDHGELPDGTRDQLQRLLDEMHDAVFTKDD